MLRQEVQHDKLREKSFMIIIKLLLNLLFNLLKFAIIKFTL